MPPVEMAGRCQFGAESNTEQKPGQLNWLTYIPNWNTLIEHSDTEAEIFLRCYSNSCVVQFILVIKEKEKKTLHSSLLSGFVYSILLACIHFKSQPDHFKTCCFTTGRNFRKSLFLLRGWDKLIEQEATKATSRLWYKYSRLVNDLQNTAKLPNMKIWGNGYSIVRLKIGWTRFIVDWTILIKLKVHRRFFFTILVTCITFPP